MTKDEALYLILEFGKFEERDLRAKGLIHEAYQIEHARRMLLYCLIKSIKRVRDVLKNMTTCSIGDDGYLVYDPAWFVADDFTRALLEEFQKKF